MLIGTFGQTIAAPSMAVSFIALLIVWRTFVRASLTDPQSR